MRLVPVIYGPCLAHSIPRYTVYIYIVKCLSLVGQITTPCDLVASMSLNILGGAGVPKMKLNPCLTPSRNVYLMILTRYSFWLRDAHHTSNVTP